jgi:hypothetical protein
MLASIDRTPLYCLIISPILPETRGRLLKAFSSYKTQWCQQLSTKLVRLKTVPQPIEDYIFQTYLQVGR